ncbi:MAG: glycosyltransferase family 4 protein [Bacteroidales bacterium]|jgi:glycosyltransferase involved in cell wall biosynthesis
MKIAVNTRLLLSNKLDGIGWFTCETLKRITKNHPEHQFYFIFDRQYSDEFIFSENITPVIAHPQARHPLLWYLFFEYGIPRKLKKIKPDLFLSTDGWIPLNIDVKIVNVIHDLNFEHFHDFIKPAHKYYFDKFFKRFAERSDRIATVSNFSKDDLNKLYNIPKDKIDVVYNGSNEDYKVIDLNEKTNIKNKHFQGCDYFLFVSSINKRKNLQNIFKAFDIFKQKNQNNVKFVVVGSKMHWCKEIEESYKNMTYKDDVIFTGYMKIDELVKIMSSALALVYPSLFEGFGIPIVEAFNAGTAVITSNITSMPEVAGDAALLVDPYSVDEIANAMNLLYNDTELRAKLIEKGLSRKDMFTWDKTASALWNTIEKVLNE